MNQKLNVFIMFFLLFSIESPAQIRIWSVRSITGISWIKSYHTDFGLAELYLPFVAYSTAKFNVGVGVKYNYNFRQPFYLCTSSDLLLGGISYKITNSTTQEQSRVNWNQLMLNQSFGGGYLIQVSKNIKLSYEANFMTVFHIVGWKGSHETSHFEEISYKSILLAAAGSVNVIFNKDVVSLGLNFQHFLTGYEPGKRSRKNYPAALYLTAGYKIKN